MSHVKKSESHDAASTVDSATVVEQLDKVIATLGLTTQVLTTKQRKAATRSRKGMEKVIATLASLSTEHGVSVPKQPTSQMTSGLALATQLDPIKQKLVSALALVESNIDSSASNSWTTATTLYGMLQKVAHRDVQLKSQLAPVKEFFGYRTPAAKKAHPKQKGKKAALAAENLATAQAATGDSAAAAPTAPAAPSPASATASTSAPSAPSNVAVPHTP